MKISGFMHAPWRLFYHPAKPAQVRTAVAPPQASSPELTRVEKPNAWPSVPPAAAVPYLRWIARSDLGGARVLLQEWQATYYRTKEVAALLRDLVGDGTDAQLQEWIRDRIVCGRPMYNSAAVAWLLEALPEACAHALGWSDEAMASQARPVRPPNSLRLWMGCERVDALLSSAVQEGTARAWARAVLSCGDLKVVERFVKKVPKSPWAPHCAAMAAALPAYTRCLLGPAMVARLFNKWRLPATVPMAPTTLPLLHVLCEARNGFRDVEGRDALMRCPPELKTDDDVQTWKQLVGYSSYEARTDAVAAANYFHVLLENGVRQTPARADVLAALLPRLSAEAVAGLTIDVIRCIDTLTVADLLKLAEQLRAHHPGRLPALVAALYEEGFDRKPANRAQCVAIEALLRTGLLARRNDSLVTSARAIKSCAPGLSTALDRVGEACTHNAPGWKAPLGRLVQMMRTVDTPKPMRAALMPLLQPMLTGATHAEAVQRCKATLRLLASPLAQQTELTQLQALHPAWVAFLRGEPLAPECSPDALRGLSPLLRDWLLLALHARLQNAPVTPEHCAFVAGCAPHRDHTTVNETLDWLELAQRFGAPLQPWMAYLPQPCIKEHLDPLRRLTAIVAQSRPELTPPLEKWLRQVYLCADLPTLLVLEQWLAVHHPEACAQDRARVFSRAALQPTPEQQEALNAMFVRLPEAAHGDCLGRGLVAWHLAPIHVRRYIARQWLKKGKCTPHDKLPEDMSILARCLAQRPIEASCRSSALELQLLGEVAPRVREARWADILADQGEPAWLRELLHHEKPCGGLAAQAQQNRLAALGRFLHVCRVLHIPTAQRDAAGGIVKQLLALPDVQARHRLLCRLGAALVPEAPAEERAALVGVLAAETPVKAIPLRLAQGFFLPHRVQTDPAVQATLATRAAYGDGGVLRQLLQLIMDEAHHTYATQVLGWPQRNNLKRLVEHLLRAPTPEQRALCEAVARALRRSTHLDAAFYKQTCVRTLLHKHVLPLQRELIVCADMVRQRGLHVDKLTEPGDIHARCGEKVGVSGEVLQRLQVADPTTRYALGFHSSMARWSKDHEGPRLLRELLEACADGTLVAYRRRSPQARLLLQQPGGEALMRAWENATALTLPVRTKRLGTEQALWVATDTGHPTQQLAWTTEVESCQSNTSPMGYNYGMLGRMTCGSKRTLGLRDAQGKLRARAMLRIMLDDARRPRLLLSHVYVAGGTTEEVAQEALDAYAAQRARGLGIGAVRTECQGLSMRLTSAGDAPDYWDEGGKLNANFDRAILIRKLR